MLIILYQVEFSKVSIVTFQSWVQLDRSGLPSETLKCESLERKESAGGAEGAVLRISALGLSLKCAASRGRVLSTSFLRRDHPDPEDRVPDHN
jgi:hypothetical protein